MYVNQRDIKNEIEILESVKPHVPILSGYEWQQSKKKTAIYDFRGLVSGEVRAGLDVKVRSIRPDAYPDYFVSTNKISVVRNNPQYDFFIVYYFEFDKLARVYYLNNLELPEKKLHFNHKRARRKMTSIVHTIGIKEFVGEVLLF